MAFCGILPLNMNLEYMEQDYAKVLYIEELYIDGHNAIFFKLMW